MKKVSIKDIAQMAGVASSTVSFVLNGKARKMRISETVEKRVIEVARNAGYYPNQLAISLRTGKSKTLGLIVENIGNPFFATLAKTIEEEAEQYGYRVVYCSTENNASKGKELINMLSQRQVDGYLITPAPHMEDDIQQLVQLNRPVVLIDRYLPSVDVSHVLVNNTEAVSQGMAHLFDRGYKEIGFVTVDLDVIQMEERLDGYLGALSKQGIRLNKDIILKIPYTHQRDEAVELIAALLKDNPQLDALFFATNYLAILGLESINRLKMAIPQDIAVISFDDHDIFRIYPPGITSIQQPVEAIAKKAVALLMEQCESTESKLSTTEVELTAKLIVRGST
ncbi:LacI family transcriptional regulator [Niastella koreensis]|uniref:Transcriptional regulator, LacI family n=2 Tax=Niastella koreensis TaxID=354356 RepID=G8TLM3_NIAKG|nr:substrate-binding domain-containing protein [Niastella koreensis]AEV96592.1 transcriptional regulator, LacI family [Niastella koreensis GR20-10]OQP54105.1 LacI family transcriptional regulator [Niastella koreensis]